MSSCEIQIQNEVNLFYDRQYLLVTTLKSNLGSMWAVVEPQFRLREKSEGIGIQYGALLLKLPETFLEMSLC